MGIQVRRSGRTRAQLLRDARKREAVDKLSWWGMMKVTMYSNKVLRWLFKPQDSIWKNEGE